MSDADRKVIEERGTYMLRDFTDRRLKAIQLAHFPIYHHTDEKGLEGIINGGLLRATDALKISGAGEIVPALSLAVGR